MDAADRKLRKEGAQAMMNSNVDFWSDGLYDVKAAYSVRLTQVNDSQDNSRAFTVQAASHTRAMRFTKNKRSRPLSGG